MKLDDLLEAMADMTRDSRHIAADDPRWLAMARGELTAEEQEEVRRLAEASDPTGEAYALLQPLDQAIKDKIVERAEGALKAKRTASPKSSRRVSRAPVIAISRWFALAAAVLAVVLWPRAPGAPLPRYDFGEVSSDGEQMRSAATAVSDEPLRIQLGRDEHFRIILRPETTVQGEVEAQAFRLVDGHATRWEVPIQRAGRGVFRIAGSVDRLMAFEPGAWTLVFVIGRRGRLPTQATEVGRALEQDARAADWQLLVQEIHIRSAASPLDETPRP